MTPEKVLVRANSYFDSVSLMVASQQVSNHPRVELATAMQATPLNIAMLETQGFAVPPNLKPNDLVIAIRAHDENALVEGFEEMDRAFVPTDISSGAGSQRSVRSWRELKRLSPSAALAVIAVPGRYAAGEAAAALEAGLDVFCFSDGVAVEHEAQLKSWAVVQGRLFMGPDCGTTVLGGVGLGFANRVRPGPVGIIGASGTGTQELCALLDQSGIGISHAIGVGSRDLGKAVGGLMTLHVLERLARDDQTEVIVIVSKPPDPAVAASICETAARLGKPVVMAALGAQIAGVPSVVPVRSIESAAAEVCSALGRTLHLAPDEVLPPTRGFARGLFCGGTLCYQAQLVMAEVGLKVKSNIPLDPALALRNVWKSEEHTFVDLGDDVFTDGRLHPMIDPSLRDERVRQEAMDPEVGVILCDVVLGDGAHPDPASNLATCIADAKKRRDDLHFIVCLCGTSSDPQDLEQQRQLLRQAGAFVSSSVESAARSVVASLEVRR